MSFYTYQRILKVATRPVSDLTGGFVALSDLYSPFTIYMDD